MVAASSSRFMNLSATLVRSCNLTLSPTTLARRPNTTNHTVRVAAAQAARRIVGFRLSPIDALAAVEKNLGELERIVDRAGEAKCDALVLPEVHLRLAQLGRCQ
jgi:hypothetical protein